MFNFDFSQASTYVVISYLLITLGVFIFNFKDPNRIWIASVLLLGATIDSFVVQQYLPSGIIKHMIVYSIMDFTMIKLIKKRVVICSFFQEKANASGRFKDVLENLECTKQEWVIRKILIVSILVNFAMIVEHFIRHPEYIGLKENPELVDKFQYVFTYYTDIKILLISLLTVALFTFTVDGVVSRKLNLDFLGKSKG